MKKIKTNFFTFFYRLENKEKHQYILYIIENNSFFNVNKKVINLLESDLKITDYSFLETKLKILGLL